MKFHTFPLNRWDLGLSICYRNLKFSFCILQCLTVLCFVISNCLFFRFIQFVDTYVFLLSWKLCFSFVVFITYNENIPREKGNRRLLNFLLEGEAKVLGCKYCVISLGFHAGNCLKICFSKKAQNNPMKPSSWAVLSLWCLK